MATYRVSNQTQLNSALGRVDDGDTIVLGSGTYRSLEMRNSRWADFDFNAKVTITSADSSNPARINELLVSDASNVEFKNVVFDYVAGRTASKPFFVEKSDNITFSNVVFDGHRTNGYGVGLGLRVKETDGITVRNSEFVNLYNGLNFQNNSDVELVGNVVRGISNDGFSFGGITDALIANNTFRDYKSPIPMALHKDSIQFRAGGSEAPSENIIIRGNNISSSDVRHGIYIGNEDYKNGDMSSQHQNFLIENNYIRSAHLHGITMLHGDGVTIRNNTLVHNNDSGLNRPVNMPLINVSIFSEDVTINGNRAASVPGEANSTWNVYGNAVGSKNYLHWAGDYGLSAQTFARASLDVRDSVELRFAGSLVNGETTIVIDEADFSQGDSFIFSSWNTGTFQDKFGGNPVDDWNDGASVRINSALDLQELVAFSPAITAETAADDLIFIIDQGRKGVAEVHFKDMAAAFLAADHPELF